MEMLIELTGWFGANNVDELSENFKELQCSPVSFLAEEVF